MNVRVALLASLLVAAGCASTGYQRMGSDGGYEDFPKDASTWVVTYTGTESMTRDTVAMYLHYRCAEVTVEAGQRYFAVVSGESRDVAGEFTTPGYVNSTTTGTGRYPYGTSDRSTTFTPPQTVKYVRPVQTATIRLSSGAKPEGGFDAREVLQMLAPRLGLRPPPASAAPLAPATEPAPVPAPAPAPTPAQ